MAWSRSSIAVAAALLLTLAPSSRLYRFTVEYFTFDVKGTFLKKQRIAGDYETSNPGDPVKWTHVTLASGTTLAGAYGGELPQRYMEGFTYQADAQRLFLPEFFKGFPADATQAKNLVWDTFMLETFAENLRHVKESSPYHMPSWAVPLAGAGTFKNTDIQLTWIGLVARGRQECALIQYEAFFNHVEHEIPGVRLVARSDYWGDIWVALATGDIEYATLYEEVAGQMTLAAQASPQPINVVRKGVFERLTTETQKK
jgi:hypothetical protein